MSSSFGNNKRKPGATAGAVTEAKRRATLAQNWDDYSKQRKVPGESIMPSFMGRNAGIQSIFYAQNNGSFQPVGGPNYHTSLSFAGFEWSYEGNGSTNVTMPDLADIQTWGQRKDNILSGIMNPNILNNTSNNGVFISMGSGPVDVAVYIKGIFTAPITGNYVFTFRKDDGLQIKLNNTVILNSLAIQDTIVTSSSISLVAGTTYPLEMLWSNRAGGLRLILTDISVTGNTIFSQLSTANYSSIPSIDTYSLYDCLDATTPITLPGNTITGSLYFNPTGTNTSYALTGYSTALNTTTGFTVEWFQKMSSLPATGAQFPRPFAIGQNANGPLSCSFELIGLNTVLRIFSAGNVLIGYNIPVPSILLNWNHFAIVYYNGGTMNLYINGSLVANATGVSIGGAAGGTNIVIGNWDVTPSIGAQFYGYITNFRITNTPVTSSSIPLRNIAGTSVLLNVVSDAYKYYNTAATGTPLTSGGTAPTFVAQPDPLV